MSVLLYSRTGYAYIAHMDTQFKSTDWIELDAARVEIVEDYGNSRKIRHPDMPRARYFVLSKAGNWYWRNTDKATHRDARGYIIK
jgi:hypothetical protein